ncbi:N-acetylmuramoyl-L-alanine amidase [Candidatus Woesearchaeota archaeon]|nr:N-acetylmuramoyl-L-alanine amidase [Candidatus Woesearchaeota archaeon]
MWLEDIIRLLERTADALEQPGTTSRRSFVLGTAAALVGSALLPEEAEAKKKRSNRPSRAQNTPHFIDSYSPKNNRRPIRSHTDYIILHTTEGPADGSLNRLRAGGFAHYMVDKDGSIYRIIEPHKYANHAGRSMWNGRTNIDNRSIGIEVVGTYTGNITGSQSTSLKYLLDTLKNRYNIKDDHILTHSMVAYGNPNKWHSRKHRGRKRCGMLFADPDIRARIGLHNCPSYDPDTKTGRLVTADAYLAKVLFGKTPVEREEAIKTYTRPESNILTTGRTPWDIAQEQYDKQSTVYTLPDGRMLRGNEIKDWRLIPSGTRVSRGEYQSPEEFEGFHEIGKDGSTAQEIAGELYNRATAIYFFSDGKIREGDQLSEQQLDALSAGTKLLVGYVYGGKVSANRSAFSITGTRWNHPTTFYRLPDGKITSGDDIDSKKIPKGTIIMFKD